jgi:hypothetical protein
MVSFQTKDPTLGKFWRALDWKMFDTLWPFGVLYGHRIFYADLVHFSGFGII